jgi:hypothetical protein
MHEFIPSLAIRAVGKPGDEARSSTRRKRHAVRPGDDHIRYHTARGTIFHRRRVKLGEILDVGGESTMGWAVYPLRTGRLSDQSKRGLCAASSKIMELPPVKL